MLKVLERPTKNITDVYEFNDMTLVPNNSIVKVARVVILFALFSLSAPTQAEEPYLRSSRVNYILTILQAFEKSKMSAIYNTFRYINVIDRNSCRSAISSLKTECLLNFANNNCSEIKNASTRENCHLYSDVIVTNKMSESSFIGTSERYRILRKSHGDFKKILTDRLHQKYAGIVTLFSMSDYSDCQSNDSSCLANGLDQFCLDYTNSNDLSWQYCVAASLWFIGTSR